jgi:hypothetical protein
MPWSSARWWPSCSSPCWSSRPAGLSASDQTLLAEFASLAVVVLVCAEGGTLRRLFGLSPPMAVLLEELGVPPAERFVTTHT